MARKLRQVVDLYTVGKVVTLRDGSPVWVQALNPFEQDTARNEAQIAKARMTMAIREFGGDEQVKVRSFFLENGLEGARVHLVEAKLTEATPRIFEKFRDDPDWTERLKILDRGDADTAKPIEEAEAELLRKISAEFATDIGERLAAEREYLTTQYADADEDILWDEYLEWYLDRRGGDVMMAEFRLHQILFGVRWCEATQVDGVWDHDQCGGHLDRMFSDKEQVRTLPQDLLNDLALACEELDMSLRDAKNSDRQGSSVDSSPLPSGEAASTASTPAETRVAPPGISSSPSTTPSPSSAGAS